MAKYKRRPKVKRYRRSFYSRGMRIRKIVGIVVLVAVVLAAAALLFVLYRANAPKAEPLVAVVDFGDGITETIPLDEDHDYLYDVGDYIVHLQVKDGAIAFLDSQCPDHVCEQFGWLSEQDAWAACVPAGVYVTVQAAETE
mgnify:CR=1 FL=1